MAINLNPGADAAIVTAATRSGLAGVPGDYSKQFESIAQSYAETMKSNTEMWKSIMETTVSLSANSIEKAGERRRANIDIRNTPGFEDIEAQVGSFQDELRKTWQTSKEVEGPQPEGSTEGEAGWMITPDTSDDPKTAQGPVGIKKVRNNSLSIENRDRRADIYKQRDAFYAEVAKTGAGLKVINDIQASGEFDAKATGAHGIELAEAFASSQTTGEHTENGNYFESSYDPKKKRIIHTLMNDGKGKGGIPKGPVEGEDGKVRTYTTEQIQDVFVMKDPNLNNNWTKLFNNAEKVGKQVGTPYDDYQANKNYKAAAQLVEKTDDLHRSIHTATGPYSNKTFHEEFTSISELSAQEYMKLASVLPKDTQGNLTPTGVLRGVDGSLDGTPGIQQEDFAFPANQNRISLAMFDKGDDFYTEQNLRETFLNWVAGKDGKLGKIHDYGMGYNTNVLANKKATDNAAIAAEKARLLAIKNANNAAVSALGKTTLADMFVGGKNSYISETQLETINNIGTSLANRSKITGPDGAYTWDDTKKSYFLADGSVVPNKATMLSWLFKNQTINPTFKESDFFKSIPEWDGSKFVEEEKEEKEEKVVESAETVETIKNDIVKQVRLPWDAVSTGVKKINGTWHKSEPVGYSGEIKWVKATQKQIDKINKSYK